MIQQKVRVGLLGVGLDTYWGQFEGLLPRLLTYQDEIAAKIEAMDVQVINTGMVDSPGKRTKIIPRLIVNTPPLLVSSTPSPSVI